MESLNKVISLREASRISGYHQDYLSSLIRKKEIKGKKIGVSWYTTEEEIKNYIFKQKVNHKKWAILDFLSFKRVGNIFVYAVVVTGLIFLALYFFSAPKNTETEKKIETNLAPNDELGMLLIEKM